MDFNNFNFLAPCLRGDEGALVATLDDCLYQSIGYYTEMLMFLIGLGAFFMLVLGGIKMATSFGEEAKYTEAKKTISHAVIGIIIATLAYTIVSFVTSFFNIDNPKAYDIDGKEVPITEEEDEEEGAVGDIKAWSSNYVSGDPNILSEAEFLAAGGGTTGDEVDAPTSGKIMIVLLNKKHFTARIEFADGTSKTLTTRQYAATSDYYIKEVQSNTSTTIYRGAKLVLTQDGEVRTVLVK